jgi:two-component system, LytTR family, sensor kinase
VSENLPIVLRSVERVPQFWALQLVGWGAYASIVSIGIAPHLRNEGMVIIAFEATFLFSTFLASFPLHFLCRRLWRNDTPWPNATFQAVLASGLLALPCAISARLAELLVLRKSISWTSMQAAFEGVLYATFILISWSGLYFSIKHYQALQTERERVLEAEALARQARLQALRYQLNPHFLFNTLNSISTLISEGDSTRANGTLTQLAGLLRSTLEEDVLQEVPLRREIGVAQEYLGIEKVRLGDRLNVVLKISPETLDALVPAFLLQPLIENAIRHGIAPRPEGGTVRIETYRSGKHFRLNVSDDGVGDQSPESQGERTRGGIGLANSIERLRVLYGADHRLVVNWPAEGGCRIEVEFPIVLSNSGDRLE